MNLKMIAKGLHLIADGLDDSVAAVAPAPAAAPAPVAPAASPAPAAPAPIPAGAAPAAEVSAEEVRDLFYALSQQHGKLDMVPLLTQLGIQKVSDASAEQRAALKQLMLETWQG